MKVNVFNVLTAIMLTIAWWIVSRFLFGSNMIWVSLSTLTGWLITFCLFIAVQKTKQRPWTILGIVVLLILFLPDAVLVRVTHLLQSNVIEGPPSFIFTILIPFAIIIAALLLYLGINPVNQNKNNSLFPLILSILLIVKIFHNFYKYMLWDNTYDPLGILWIVIPALAVIVSSMFLIGLLPGKLKITGLTYLFIIPALTGITTYTQGIDFHQLTETRAEQVKQAVEAYYAREGRYPANLQELSPLYQVEFAKPIIIFGQDWCYQGGTDYYRLGYLDRDHWSSPIRFGRVYASQGHPPLKTDVCQSAITAYRIENPNVDHLIQDYGRPVPTPDIGE